MLSGKRERGTPRNRAALPANDNARAREDPASTTEFRTLRGARTEAPPRACLIRHPR